MLTSENPMLEIQVQESVGEFHDRPQFHEQSQTQTQALKNPVSKQEGKIHTNNHCQLKYMITISKFDNIIELSENLARLIWKNLFELRL